MARNRKERQIPVELGALVKVQPEKLVAGGESLSRIDGFPLFVGGLYPGDEATVEIVEVKAGFARGAIVSIDLHSRLRRAAPCPIARECGGCNWTELRLDAQLDAKQAILIESLTRIGRVPPESLPPIRVHPSPLNYRLRSRLHADSASGKLGFFAPASHQVVPLSDRCEVVGLPTRDAVHDADRLGESDEIIFFESSEGVHQLDPESAPAGQSPLTRVHAAGRDWTAPVAGFFQVNRHLLGRMHDLVESIGAGVGSRELAFDLYGGVGFFAAPLARHFRRVISVESHPDGHRCARINLRTIKGAEADSRSAELFMRNAPPADMIFLDPPRAGAADEVILRCAELARETVCYLSCDPVTFSRDASRLLRRGWTLSEIHLLDLFPNTHHVETLAAFRRA